MTAQIQEPYRLESFVREGGPVSFPSYTGERVYMRGFFKDGGLPQDLKRWQPTVDAMLAGIDTGRPIYIMIDQGFVKAGACHRRPGLHIDGYWDGTTNGHGHQFIYPKFRHEALILASDVQACSGYIGEYDGYDIMEDGDACHVETRNLKKIELQPNRVYMGNAGFLHESVPVKFDCYRTFVRLNVSDFNVTQ